MWFRVTAAVGRQAEVHSTHTARLRPPNTGPAVLVYTRRDGGQNDDGAGPAADEDGAPPGSARYPSAPGEAARVPARGGRGLARPVRPHAADARLPTGR